MAQIDITKIDKLGHGAKYFLSDYKVVLWQPNWLNIDYKGGKYEIPPDIDAHEEEEQEDLGEARPISEMAEHMRELTK